VNGDLSSKLLSSGDRQTNERTNRQRRSLSRKASDLRRGINKDNDKDLYVDDPDRTSWSTIRTFRHTENGSFQSHSHY